MLEYCNVVLYLQERHSKNCLQISSAIDWHHITSAKKNTCFFLPFIQFSEHLSFDSFFVNGCFFTDPSHQILCDQHHCRQNLNCPNYHNEIIMSDCRKPVCYMAHKSLLSHRHFCQCYSCSFMLNSCFLYL